MWKDHDVQCRKFLSYFIRLHVCSIQLTSSCVLTVLEAEVEVGQCDTVAVPSREVLKQRYRRTIARNGVLAPQED